MRCNRKVPPYWLVLQAQLSEFESEISECKYTWTYFTWYDVITTSKMQKQIYVFMCPSWDRNKENISVIEENKPARLSRAASFYLLWLSFLLFLSVKNPGASVFLLHRQMVLAIFFFHYIEFTSHVREPSTFSRYQVVIRGILLYTFFFLMTRVSGTKRCIAYCWVWHEILLSTRDISSSWSHVWPWKWTISNLELILLLKVNDISHYFRIGKSPADVVCMAVGCMDGMPSLVAVSHS